MTMLDQLSACPRCSEPLAAGERFCGVCGADLTAVVGPAGIGGAAPHEVWPPTVADNGVRTAPPSAPQVPPGSPDFTLAPADGRVPDVQGRPPAQPPVQGPPPVPPPQPAPPLTGAPPAAPPLAGPPPPVPPPPSVPPPPMPPPPVHPASAPPVSAAPPLAPEAAASPVPPEPAAPDPRAADPRVTLDDSPSGTPPEGPPPNGPGPHAPAGGSGTRCVACGTGAVDGDGYCDHCGHKQPRERDHMESVLASVAAASDRGLRHHRNEDFYALHEAVTPQGATATIAVVCDGVSSATRPDDASAAAARTAGDLLLRAVPQGAPPQQAMHDALMAAADAVAALAAEGPNEPSKNAPACTIVGALTAEGILTVGWIGDSRAYWVPDEQGAPPARLTEDDSWAAQMVAAGLMTEDEAYADARAHAITGWLGADAYEIEPHTASYKPEGPGVVIVCTDGLWNYAESAEQMAAAVPVDGRARPLPAAQRLVGFALDGGGHDNATVAVIPFPVPSPGAVQG